MPDQSFLEQQIAAAKEQMGKEMPDVANTTVQPMGLIGSLISGAKDKLTGGTTMALTNPFTGSISYNPAALQGQPQSAVEDMLAHELTHTRQARDKSLLSKLGNSARTFFSGTEPYGQTPDELEAFQTEADRARNQ